MMRRGRQPADRKANEWSCLVIDYRNGMKQTLVASPGDAPRFPARRKKAMQE